MWKSSSIFVAVGGHTGKRVHWRLEKLGEIASVFGNIWSRLLLVLELHQHCYLHFASVILETYTQLGRTLSFWRYLWEVDLLSYKPILHFPLILILLLFKIKLSTKYLSPYSGSIQIKHPLNHEKVGRHGQLCILMWTIRWFNPNMKY
jgi:hypothetical protein